MANSYGPMFSGYLPNTLTNLFTPSTAVGAIAGHWNVVNLTGSSATFQFFIGTASTNGFAVTPILTVNATSFTEFDLRVAIGYGENLYGIASAANTLSTRVDGSLTPT